jgi:multiple sugar transport system permease protein
VREPLVVRVVRSGLLLAAVVFFLFPIFWIVSTTFKPQVDLFSVPPVWVFTPTLDNYTSALRDFDVLSFLRNSAIIALGSTVLSLALGVPAAYAIARAPSQRLKSLANVFMLIRLVPPVAVLIPLYLLMRDLRLLGTYFAVIAISTVLNSAFVVWTLHVSFSDLPVEVEEAALCDGCSRFRTFWQIALPMARPALIAAAMFCILFSWNDFIFALLLTSPATKTLPVALLATIGSVNIGWGELAVMSEITVLPVVVVALLLNRYLVQGLTAGAN